MTQAGERLIRSAKNARDRMKQRQHETPEDWAARLAPTFFADLERKQRHLGPEFEAAIFSDLAGLYED